MVRIGRGSVSNDIVGNAFPIPNLPPHAGKLHTLSVVYIAGKGSISRLEAFWDGVSIGYTNNSYKAINWGTSTGIFIGRFNDISPVGKSYNAGFKVFRKVLTTSEMLDQHTNRPVLVDKLIVATQDDYVVNVSFENVTVDGFIVRINNVFPYNTDDRLYKLAFRDEVFDIATNIRVAIGVEELQTNAETSNFNSYNLPYDIPITRALYPALFPINSHVHKIELYLRSNTNSLIVTIKGLFISPTIPKFLTIPDIYIDWSTQSIRDKTGAFIDDIIILNNSSNSASSPSQYQLLDNKVMRFNQNNHIRMRTGIPALLKDYQGDLTMCYVGASKATSGIAFLLDFMNWFGQITGWVIKIMDRGYATILGRLSGHLLSTDSNIPVNLPYKNLHTISFAYTERYTANDSKMEVYWDGIKLNETISPYSPIRYDTGDNLYIGRFGNQFINGDSYVNDLKVYKKAFNSQEMLDEHTNIPTGLTQFDADTA
jgi:hypothetical protein